MGRTTLLDKIIKKINIENTRENTWLLTYSFINTKPNPHFYKQLTELTSKLHKTRAIADKTQTSVFITNDLHGAIAAMKIAKHYQAKVRLYNIEEYYPNPLLDPDENYWINDDELYSLKKAAYHELKKLQSYSSSQYTDHLTSFLWITELTMVPTTPVKKQDIETILSKSRYLEQESNRQTADRSFSYGFGYSELGSFMKLIENYLREHRDESTEAVEDLFNIYRRFTGDEDPPYEPRPKDVEELLRQHPKENYQNIIRKGTVIEELFS